MAVNVSQPHVLAVDDSLVDRTFIERLLKISAYRVTTVDSGRRALELLGLEGDEQIEGAMDEMKVNMVITDYCMPGMTGYELLKKIKECAALKEIPVVIMSSENVGSRVDRCLEEGAEEFIVKPVKLSDVMRLKDYIPKKHHHQVEEEEDIEPNPQDLLPPPQTLKRKLPSLTSSPSPPQDHSNDDDDDVNDTSSSHSPQTTSSPSKCNDMASPSPSKPPSQRRARVEKQQPNHVNASLVA